jgi:hypothetical protein
MQLIFYCVWLCSYMAALEDTLNIGMCGLFLLILAALCLIAFSAVTVNYCLNFWYRLLRICQRISLGRNEHKCYRMRLIYYRIRGYVVRLICIITLLWNSGKAREIISQIDSASAFFSVSFFRCPCYISIPSLFKQWMLSCLVLFAAHFQTQTFHLLCAPNLHLEGNIYTRKSYSI